MFLGTPTVHDGQLSILSHLCSPRDLALQATPKPWVVLPIQRGLALARATEEEKGTAPGTRGEDES